jgi:Flp pilus assembly pilin Flp
MSGKLSTLCRDESGTEVVEYALLLGMIVCVCLLLIAALGSKIVQKWMKINDFLDVGS